MGRKLTELNAAELTAVLVEIAEPVGNLVNDDELWNVFKACTAKGVTLQQKNGLRYILQTYSAMLPLLLGEKHSKDTFRILSAIEGKPIAEIMQMNGQEVVKAIGNAFKEQLMPFFTTSVVSE